MSIIDLRSAIIYWDPAVQDSSVSYMTGTYKVPAPSTGYYGSNISMYSSSSYMPMTSTYVTASSAYYPSWGLTFPKPEDSPFITVGGREYRVEFDPNGSPLVYRQGRMGDIGRRILNDRWFRVKREERERVLAEFTLRKMAAGEKQEAVA